MPIIRPTPAGLRNLREPDRRDSRGLCAREPRAKRLRRLDPLQVPGRAARGYGGLLRDSDHGQLRQTTYGYNANGLLEWTETPNGTITWNVLDASGDVLSTWIGTNDAGATDTNPHGSGGANNMVEVSANLYDADGDVTQSTDYQYAGAASTWDTLTPTARVTQNFYDWRDRLVVTKSGVLLEDVDGVWEDNLDAEPFDGVQRPLTYYVMDNLGEVTATYVFSGSGLGPGVADYTIDSTDLDPSTADLLRSYSTTSYDSLGQVYQTAQYSVDQTYGTIGSAETTNYSYDADGNLTTEKDPIGNITSFGYDGMDQQTTVLQPTVSVFNTTTREYSNVAPLTTTAYDAAGNVISVEDPDDNVTTFAYDGIGREVSQTGAIASDVTTYSLQCGRRAPERNQPADDHQLHLRCRRAAIDRQRARPQ